MRPFFLAFAPFAFSSCWYNSSSIASTDVDNEITVAVSGSATNGEALALQTVVLLDQNGDSIASSSTDSLGSFEIRTNRKTSSVSGLWSLVLRNQNLRVALPQPDQMGRAYVLVNPLASYAYQKLAPNRPAGPMAISASADSLLGLLLGGDFRYQNAIDGRDFRPIGAPSPKPIAGLIYQLQNQASAQGKTLEELLDSVLSSGEPLFKSQNFLVGLIGQANQRGLDSLDFRRELETWVGMGHDGPMLDPLFKAVREAPRSPQIDLLSPAVQPIVMDGFNALQARFFGPPPQKGEDLNHQPSDSLRMEIPYLWPYLDTLMIGTGMKIQNWTGKSIEVDQRARILMNNLGDRLGGCLALYQSSGRSQNPSAAVGICNRTIDQFLAPMPLDRWLLQSDTMVIRPLMQLADRNLLRQKLVEELQKQGKAALLPLLP